MSAILEGRRLGVYKLERQLGRGGMGAVYLGRDTALDREVAIKILPAELSSDPEYVERFVREARTAAKLNHPNVVQVHSAGFQEGVAFIALELVQGGSLADLAKQNPVGVRRAVEIVRDAARGLQAAHEMGVVHRDIKPENVLLTRQGQVKLADFGLARIETNKRITKSGSYVGTPHYSSPEQCNGDTVGPPSDMYSLGVVLYELLARELPFEAPTPLALFSKILSQPPPSLGERRPDLPPSLVAVVDRLLSKDPTRRPADAAALIGELEAVLRGLPPDEEESATPTVQLLGGQETPTLPTPRPEEAARILSELSGGAVGPSTARPPEMQAMLVRLVAVAAVLVLALGGLMAWSASLRPRKVAVLDWHNGPPVVTDFEWLSSALPEFVAAGLGEVELLEPSADQRASLAAARDEIELQRAREAIMQRLGADIYVAGTYLEVGGDVAVVTRIYTPGRPAAAMPQLTFPRQQVLARLGDHANDIAARIRAIVGSPATRSEPPQVAAVPEPKRRKANADVEGAAVSRPPGPSAPVDAPTAVPPAPAEKPKSERTQPPCISPPLEDRPASTEVVAPPEQHLADTPPPPPTVTGQVGKKENKLVQLHQEADARRSANESKQDAPVDDWHCMEELFRAAPGDEGVRARAKAFLERPFVQERPKLADRLRQRFGL